MALLSFFFHCSATSFARGSSGLGALNNAWIDSNTVRICRAGDHLSGRRKVRKKRKKEKTKNRRDLKMTAWRSNLPNKRKFRMIQRCYHHRWHRGATRCHWEKCLAATSQSIALRCTSFLRLLDNEKQGWFFKHFSTYQCIHVSSFCKDFFKNHPIARLASTRLSMSFVDLTWFITCNYIE